VLGGVEEVVELVRGTAKSEEFVEVLKKSTLRQP